MKTKLVKIIALILSMSLMIVMVGCKSDSPDKDYDNNDSQSNTHQPYNYEDGKCYVNITVKNFGTIIVELYPESAPITVSNFISLVEQNFYSGTTFHRILSNFMIQGGAPNSSSPFKPTPITGEFSSNGYDNPTEHTRGVISMARTNDPNSATSQFFICNANSPHLNGLYAAFGCVVRGMDIVDAITEYGMQYTSSYLNGMIHDTDKQPVIEKMELVDKR